MKKPISILIISAILAAVLFTNINAYGESVTVNGLKFNEYGSYCVLVSCDNTMSGEVVIPAEVDFGEEALPVTSIEFNAFMDCTAITGVKIPDSVTSISNYAFQGCTGLKSISMPKSVWVIGSNAFYGCSGLETITVDENNTTFHSSGNCLINTNDKTLVLGCKNSVIPDDGSVTKIVCAFAGNEAITSITIPDAVKSIGESAFYNCTGLTSITIPDGMQRIGDYAFSFCRSLTELDIPASVSSIGFCAFDACSGLESINVDEGNHVYHSNNNCLIETESKTLVLGCKNSVIPSDGSVTEIGVDAFAYCSGLQSIVIPACVTKIGLDAFYRCTGLQNVTIQDGVQSMEAFAFGGCSSLTDVSIPDSVTEIGECAFDDCESLKFNEYGNALYLGNSNNKYYALIKGKDVSITSADVNEKTKLICGYAFYGFTELETVTMPNGLTSIGAMAFYNCSSLSSVAIPSGVTAIETLTFANCSSLTSVTIPEGVKLIDENAFERCVSLESIRIPDSVRTIGSYAFYQCKSLKEIVMPKKLTDLGEYAFYECEYLSDIKIPYGISTVNTGTFYGCGNMTSVIIPATVTQICMDAFGGTSILEVYFKGTGEQWNSIDIDIGNEILKFAEVIYNYVEPGDVNEDGDIDNKDVVVLFRYVSSGSALYDVVYDFNGDEEVNNKDVVALFRHVSSF